MKPSLERFLKRGDVILFVILLLVGAGGWLTVRLLQARNSPTAVKITTADRVFQIPLNDTTFTLAGPLGKTEIRIADRKVWVQTATCRHKLCKKQGRISRPGESIICLPNRIVITIKGPGNLDATTY